MPDQAELARAVLARVGARIMTFAGGVTIGVWSDWDGPEVRAALRTLGADRLPVRYLDAPSVPMQYKLRQVEGEPVPLNVRAEMERHPKEPWKVRDQMLNQMGWRLKGIPWAEWKAATLYRLFQEQGAIRHSERKAAGDA